MYWPTLDDARLPRAGLRPSSVPVPREFALSDVIAPRAFLRKTYDEAFALLVEARNYFAYRQAGDVDGLEAESRLLVSQETMRITCRLTQVMAWLFCQRAVENGEKPADWALSEENALSAQDVCLEDHWVDDARLPPAVRGLSARSLSLYIRVGRLEHMLRAS
ncbi:MAG: DUF1465 family protein [Alphaproteobacteria bacterium]|jgi:regulator of CtrA degradation|nr:DUF1465 family protein [Alphaproteobacteria bacterium]